MPPTANEPTVWRILRRALEWPPSWYCCDSLPCYVLMCTICFDLYCIVEMGILPWPIGLTMTTHKNVRLYIHQQSDFRTPFIASRNTNRHKRGLTREVELCESTNRTDLQNSIRAHSHPDGIYGINTFLALSLNHAKALNKTSCWVCTHIPHSAVSGIPLLAISFQFNKWCGYWVRWMYRDKWDNNTKEWQEGWVDQVITDSTKKCLQRWNLSNWYWPIFRGHTGLWYCLVQRSSEERTWGTNECKNDIYENHTIGPQAALNNTYFVCGNRSNQWLPVNWTGSCYLAYIIPHMRLLVNSPFEHPRRGKWSFPSTELFFMVLIPNYGVGQTSIGIAELAASGIACKWNCRWYGRH